LTVAVTGAGGFIGNRVCRALRARGARVVGIDVNPATAKRVVAAGAEFRAADTTESKTIADALRDATLVVHTAAIVSDWGSMREFERVNVGGTKNVLDGAEAAGASRVVHISSVVVWGYRFTRDVSEDEPYHPCGIPYIDTKIASEQIALSRGAAVIRPGDVYGPGSVPWTIRPVELLKRGLMILPYKGLGLMTTVYIDDLVDCILRALTYRPAAGQGFTAWDGDAVTAAEFFGYYARMLGGRPIRTAPTWLMKGIALPSELVARLTGRPPQVSRNAIEFVSRRAVYPNLRARQVLGWEPEVSLDEGMRRTEEWLRAEGLLG
jgi:nucleoside-diphosphate-sugar epimerase